MLSNIKLKKIAVLISHPVEYQVPFFKKLAREKDLDLTVFFCWDFGVRPTYDKDFGSTVKWDIPLLDGYKYMFLCNLSFKPSGSFFGQINPGIVFEIFKNKFDAIIIFSWTGVTNWLAFAAAFFTGTKIILRAETPLNQESLKPKWRLFIKKIILKPLFKIISAFLSIGKQNELFYKSYDVSEEKIFFAPYAVDNDRFFKEKENLASKRESLRFSLGIKSEDVVILFSGKLIEKKRPKDLLKAFEKLSNASCHLIFMGDGELKLILEQYIRKNKIKNVHFVGFKNQTEVGGIYSMADVFVLPSGLGETWGLVVNEAMCFGLPVIVSDIVGCGHDLVSKENGFVFNLGDFNELARLLFIFVSNRKIREEFGHLSSKKILEYSYEQDIIGMQKALNFIIKK